MNRYVPNMDNFLEEVTCCLKEKNALDPTLLTIKSRYKSMKIKQKGLVIT